MGLDLTRLQPLMTDLVLVDRCSIFRDAEGTEDDVLDPDSLSYEEPDDADLMESDVPFSFRAEGVMPRVGEAGAPTVIGEYTLSFPVGEPERVKAGDVVVIDDCRHNPASVGLFFVVYEVLHVTFAVMQQARARMRQEGVDLP